MTIDSKRKLSFFLIVFAAVTLVMLIEHVGFLGGIDTYSYDTSLRIRGSRTVSEKIVLVAVDNRTLTRLGRWPLQRRNYASLLDRLRQAEVVGFDLLMTEPTADDQLLAAAIQKQGKVILPVYFDDDLQPVKPLPAFAPFKTGHIHIEHGIDNVTRSMFHTLYSQNEPLYSLPSVMYETVTGTALERQTAVGGTIRQQHDRKLLQLDQRKINFYGPPGSFTQLSLVDVIDGIYPEQFFSGKAVLVGLTAPGIVDEIATPFSQNRNMMFGVEVLANALNNLFDGNSVKEFADWKRQIVALLASFALCIAFMRLNEKKATLLLILALVMTTLSTYILLSAFDFWLSPSLFLVSFSLVFFISYIYNLDSAARELDSEHSAVTSLLGWENGKSTASTSGRGLFGLLSADSIHAKIQRLIWVEHHYGKTLEDTVGQRTRELSDALVMINSMSNEMILRLTRAVESKDEGTGQHIVRVGLYAARIAEALAMPADFIESIRFASAMHDVGKIGIPDKILMKPGRFDADEMEIMKRHSVIGGEILADSPYPTIQMAARIALSHHESWDGTGYPEGLKGEEIPIEARIITICDCYDALRSKRSYKYPLDHQTACEIIKQKLASQFEPRVLGVFYEVADDLAVIFDQHQN